MFTLAHISDIHLGPLPRPKRRHLVGKRLLGYVNWHRSRKKIHQRHVLEALTNDLKRHAHDHIAVTGDLVNLGLPEEYLLALDWLHTLGPPAKVSVVPGNHDAYARLGRDPGMRRWTAYMKNNDAGAALSSRITGTFPYVRIFGKVAIVGTTSAIMTGPFVAAGRLGPRQRAALRNILKELGEQDFFRIMLIHHPPVEQRGQWMHGLRDAAGLRDLLYDTGAELVLHGHDHTHMVRQLPSKRGDGLYEK